VEDVGSRVRTEQRRAFTAKLKVRDDVLTTL
jgi:hypothetical protein